jgi:hypothetical protein
MSDHPRRPITIKEAMADTPSGWQPIETAPTDGMWVLLAGGKIGYGWWDEPKSPPVVVGQFTHIRNDEYKEDGWWHFAWYDGGFYGEYESPTHWMPIPEPPEAP